MENINNKKKLQDSDIYAYIKNKPTNEKIRGMRKKDYVMVRADIFKPLLDSIKNNENCHYVTYINDAIRNGENVEFLQAIRKSRNVLNEKKDNYPLGQYKELCAGRVLNFFGSPTTYEDVVDLDGESYVLSVNFLKDDEEFIEVNNISENIGYGTEELRFNVSMITQAINMFIEKEDIDKDKGKLMLYKFINEYIYSYLIRKHALRDGDYNFNNVGIIYNKGKKELHFAPNFDGEYSFGFMQKNRVDSFLMAYYMREDFRFVKNNFPRVFEMFAKNFHEFFGGHNGEGAYINIIENVMGKSNLTNRFIDDYANYLGDVNSILKTIERNNELVM